MASAFGKQEIVQLLLELKNIILNQQNKDVWTDEG